MGRFGGGGGAEAHDATRSYTHAPAGRLSGPPGARGALAPAGGHLGGGRCARGKGTQSYEARFSPSRSPFPGTSLLCAVVWSSVLVNACMLLYWWRQAEPIFLFRRTEGGLRSRPVPGGCCIAGANLLLPVVLLVLTCSCLSLYCRRSLAPVCCRITGIDPLPLTTKNRPAARAAFPSDETKIGSA